jgi:ABC-type transport system involved in resistance to organic solvents, ATPase component
MKPDSQIEIKTENLHKYFGGNKVLRGINIEFHTGEIIAIVGASGCGKTVLLNTILGQYAPDQGVIRILDRAHKKWQLKNLADFGDLEIDNIHKHWGVVFQRNALFSGSVFLNIALWLREVKGLGDDAILPIAERALEAVGLPADQAFLEESINDLSGGMAKRLAIARAISMNPYLFFYDEPTTGLDPTSSANIHDLIYSIHNSTGDNGSTKTSIIISHDKDLLMRLRPRTVMLHQGKVHFDGPFEEFETSSSGVIRPYFKLMPLLHGQPSESVSYTPDLSTRKGLVM